MRVYFRCFDTELVRLGREEGEAIIMGYIPMMCGDPIAKGNHWSASGGALSSLANRVLSMDFS